MIETGRVVRCTAVVLLAALPASCGTAVGREPVTAGPSTSVAYLAPPASEHAGERYESQSWLATADGAAWEFREGLSVRITGATRLSPQLGAHSRGDAGKALVRIDFSYTNNGPAVNLSEGRQQPVRLLYGEGQAEAAADPGYVGTSDQLTLRVPTSVASGVTVRGANSFAVPVAATDTLAVLVVEPRRYTEHLFTNVQHLLSPG